MQTKIVVAATVSSLLMAGACFAQAGGASDNAKPPTPEQLRALPKPSAALNEPAGPKPPELKGRENAALVYYKAWDSIDRAVFTDVSQNYKNEPRAKLSEVHLQALRDNQRFVQSIMRATELDDCDWGVDFEEGPNALLPHLSFLRGSCRFLGADVRRCVEEGDINGAAKRVTAIIRMSTQERSDRCLISSLVAVAINAYAATVTRNMMTEKSLTPEAAHVILAGFKGMPDDPFGYKTCLDMERNMLHWTKTHFTGEHAGEEFTKAMAEMGGGNANNEAELKKMDEAALAVELDKAARFYDELDKLWGQAGKDKEFRDLEDRMSNGEFGNIAMVLAPAVSKANQSGLKAKATLEAIEKELEAYIRGEPAPESKDSKPATGESGRR
jgi:hypothetical protein